MTYNFTKSYDRRNEGSRKWEAIPKSKECEEHSIVPMTVADLDIQTAPAIKKAIKEYAEKSVLGYSKPSKEYFSVVNDYMEENYHYSVKADWIVPTPGIVPALASSVRAFTEPEDGVIVFPPVYNPFYEVIEEQKREILACPLELENQRYQINFELFEQLASKEKAKLVILCSPHNPSGRVWSRTELTKISEIAEKHNLIVVSDEIHADMTLKDHTHHLYAGISEEAASHSLVCSSA